MEIEQTGNPGHYTIWGEADEIARFVTAVDPVKRLAQAKREP